jgi:p-cumate 2,3-dioxygenase subunit beta
MMPGSLQQEVERLLYGEAALLDAWQLEEWLALYTADARYVVPSADYPQNEPPEYPALIDDDFRRLKGRVTRLLSRHAHREHPSSRTRHFVSNVLITAVSDDEISVTAAFAVYRFRGGQSAPYIGRYVYSLARVGGTLKIRQKRAELDMGGLWEQGTVSILL